MATKQLQRWRKAMGALKDSATIGLANLNSDFRKLDVAVVKATNHVEQPPKERHVRKILAVASIARPRAEVAYCINALYRRLAKTRSCTVALKTLIVVHRILKEGDPTFREELLSFSQRARILRLSNFKDDSSAIAWDCSLWVRTYASFLEERLECFRMLKYDVEAEHLIRPTQGPEKGYSRTRDLCSEELLEQLSALQKLLNHLIGCCPEGAAISNHIIQYALALVLKESFKLYCAINDGIINLVDKFFEMPRHEAIKALEIYRGAGQQARSLSKFYEVCWGLVLGGNLQTPILREPPRSFLATMEDYIKEAQWLASVSRETLELPERLLLTYKSAAVPAIIKETESSPDESSRAPSYIEVVHSSSKSDALDTGDFFGLEEINPNASTIEESNALALAIIPASIAADSGILQDKGFDPLGWELALATIPSSHYSNVAESQLAGSLSKLSVDSVYDEAAHRQRQQQLYGAVPPNPFMMEDPVAMWNHVAPPPAGQMDQMPIMSQSNPFAQHQVMAPASNPFDDAGFVAFPVGPHHHNDPFGSTRVI